MAWNYPCSILVGLTLLCIPVTSAAQEDTSQADAKMATARVYFQNGVELLQEDPPNYQDAYHQFLLALETSGGNWKVLGNLGFSALKLERDGEALSYYERYLKEGGDKIDPDERATIEKELLLIKGNIATAKITSSDPKALVRVTRAGSSVPTQAYELDETGALTLGLRSGSFEIVLQSAGSEKKWKVVLTPGQEVSHRFSFEETAPGGTKSKQQGEAEPASEKDRRPLFVPGLIAAGVGVVALGGGAVTGLVSNSREKTAQEGCVDNFCPTAGQDDMNAAKSLSTVANVLFISGGVLVATGVTLVILGSGDDGGEETARLRLSPSMAPSGAGIWASGTF